MEAEKHRAAVEAIAKAMTTAERPTQPGVLPLPEIPEIHQGKLFNLGGGQRPDGSAHSLDLSLQPFFNRSAGQVGLGGAHLIFRKTW